MRNMTSVRNLCAILTLATLVACVDLTGIEPLDLEGTWTAQAMVISNGTDMVDLVALGAAMTITLNVDGTFTWIITEPGVESVVADGSGTFVVEGATLTLSETGEGGPEDYTVVRVGDTLTLTVPDEWDFNGDEVLDDATLTIGLVR